MRTERCLRDFVHADRSTATAGEIVARIRFHRRTLERGPDRSRRRRRSTPHGRPPSSRRRVASRPPSSHARARRHSPRDCRSGQTPVRFGIPGRRSNPSTVRVSPRDSRRRGRRVLPRRHSRRLPRADRRGARKSHARLRRRHARLAGGRIPAARTRPAEEPDGAAPRRLRRARRGRGDVRDSRDARRAGHARRRLGARVGVRRRRSHPPPPSRSTATEASSPSGTRRYEGGRCRCGDASTGCRGGGVGAGVE